jgi:hypothetical protein
LEYQNTQLKYVHSPRNDFESLNTLFREANAICKTFADGTTHITTVIDMLIKKIKDSGEKGQMIAKELKKGEPAESISHLWARWKVLYKDIKKAKIVLTTFVGDNCYDNTPNKNSLSTDNANLSKRKRKQQERALRNAADLEKPTKVQRTSDKCKACGKTHGGSCRFIQANHFDANTADLPWDDSSKGKAWKAIGKDSCDFKSRIDGTPFEFKIDSKKGDKPDRFKRHNTKSKYDYMFAMEQLSGESYTVTVALNSEYTDSKLTCQMLIDTGSLQSNYVNLKTAAWLRATQEAVMVKEDFKRPTVGHTSCQNNCLCLNKITETVEPLLDFIDTSSAVVVQKSIVNVKQKPTSKFKRARSVTKVRPNNSAKRRSTRDDNNTDDFNPNKRSRVCSGISGMCTDSPGEVLFSLTFYNEVTGKKETIPNIVAKILDTPYDFIIGLPDIRKWDKRMRRLRGR